MEKRSVDDTPEDATLVQRPEMQGMHVWWIVSGDNTKAERILMNTAEFPPGVNHGLHRHPHAEEVIYLLNGEGYHLSEGDPILHRAGEAIHVPAGEWHGFYNHTDEPVRQVAVWGGVSSLEAAGYEEHPDNPPVRVEPADG
jgi:quercetin dioxygenase-like cupin family protein